MTTAEEKKIHYDSIDVSDIRVMRIRDRRVDARISSLYKQEFVAFRTDDMVKVVVDLSDVEFMDSSGLGALLLGRRMFTEDGGDLKIVGAHDKVMGMFRIAKLDRVFNFHDTTDAAITKFNEQSV
jgi:anti-sigma B factor antagonist